MKKGLWVPKKILQSSFSPIEKLIISFILSFKECFATNKGISEYLGIKVHHVEDFITKFKKMKMLIVKNSYSDTKSRLLIIDLDYDKNDKDQTLGYGNLNTDQTLGYGNLNTDQTLGYGRVNSRIWESELSDMGIPINIYNTNFNTQYNTQCQTGNNILENIIDKKNKKEENKVGEPKDGNFDKPKTSKLPSFVAEKTPKVKAQNSLHFEENRKFTNNPELIRILDDFLTTLLLQKSLHITSWRESLKQLKKMGNGNENWMIEISENCLAKGYRGFYVSDDFKTQKLQTFRHTAKSQKFTGQFTGEKF